MKSEFLATYERLLRSNKYPHKRFIFNSFNLNSRLTGLIGPRGTGKTTLLLQYIKEKIDDVESAIYLSLDNIYFTQNKLLTLVNELYDIDGIRYFFLDEVHKYKDWVQEIKNIYDSYPDAKIIISGSSSMDLIKGGYDLSRRGKMFNLPGMSFREYLNFNSIGNFSSYSLNEILNNHKEIMAELNNYPKILKHFQEYLNSGYYPYVFEDEANYHSKLLNTVNKTIYEDISHYYNIKTENLYSLRKIIAYLATISPGELNRNNISKHMGLDNKTIANYLNILDETGLAILVGEGKQGSKILKSSEKIYLNNPNLYNSIATEIGYEVNIGTVREIFFINMLKNAGEDIFYSKKGDFMVGDKIFEIGGRTKNKKQIAANIEKSYLVKDNILYSSKHELPLFLFGFLY